MLFSRQQNPELISLHIPKTAGTSFRNILKSVYGEKQVVRFDINEIGSVRLNEVPYLKKELPPVKVIHGHFEYTMLEQHFSLPGNYKLITWMRDPVQRVVSNFFYLESRLKEILDEKRNNLNILSKMQRTLIEYARAEINRNRQAKFLAGRNAETFDFIGIQEYFDDEIKRLAAVLEWKSLPKSLHHNKTSMEAAVIPEEVLQEIRALNMEDMKLYEEALRMREHKIKSS